jgi:hypothetical protein
MRTVETIDDQHPVDKSRVDGEIGNRSDLDRRNVEEAGEQMGDRLGLVLGRQSIGTQSSESSVLSRRSIAAVSPDILGDGVETLTTLCFRETASAILPRTFDGPACDHHRTSRSILSLRSQQRGVDQRVQVDLVKAAIPRLIRRERDDSEDVAVDRQDAGGDLPAIARAEVLKIAVRDDRTIRVLGEFAKKEMRSGGIPNRWYSAGAASNVCLSESIKADAWLGRRSKLDQLDQRPDALQHGRILDHAEA